MILKLPSGPPGNMTIMKFDYAKYYPTVAIEFPSDAIAVHFRMGFDACELSKPRLITDDAKEGQH